MRRMVNSRAVRFLDRRAAEQVVDGSTVSAREAVTRHEGEGGRAPNLQAARRPGLAAYHATRERGRGAWQRGVAADAWGRDGTGHGRRSRDAAGVTALPIIIIILSVTGSRPGAGRTQNVMA